MHRSTALLGALTLAGALVATARADEEHHHVDWNIASTAPSGGQLAVDWNFATVVGVDYDATLTGVLPPGFTGYSGTDPGFASIADDEIDEGLYRLPAGTTVTLEITAIDAGSVSIFFASPSPATLSAVGQTHVLGTQDAPPPGDLHHHGEMRLILSLPVDQPGTGTFSFRLAAPGFTPSEEYTVTLANTHLFVDYGAGTPSSNLKCQKAIGKNVAKFLGGYAKTLYKCLDKVAAVVAAEEQGLPTESAEAQADRACGDAGGSLVLRTTLIGRLANVSQKALDGVAKSCSSAFGANQIARHLNKGACDVQYLASQGYAEAHAVLGAITSGGTPVVELLPCILPARAGEGEAPF
ncbi:MAG: hypothetical protein KIT14_12380 [bacterium]|nr:hypothetical protein [bacterium]